MNDNDGGPPEERFGRRKDRRKPLGARHRRELTAGQGATSDEFSDSGLQALRKSGRLLSLGRMVRSGKEATVYRAEGPAGPLAAKVYSDAEVRSFKEDRVYLEGRHVADRKTRKMLGDARRRGLSPRLAHWVFHEYRMLWMLADAGIPGPRPTVGPDPVEVVEAGRTVLMEWIGDEEPAPRLSDVALDPHQAADAWQQALGLARSLLELGIVHGDLSTFNLLWWRGKIMVIDVPQAVEVARNRFAGELLDRDVASLCSSFRAHGIREEPALVALELRRSAGLPPSGPLTR